MTNDELYEMIYRKYKFVKKPSDEELEQVKRKLLDLYEKKGFVTNGDLLDILNSTLANTTQYCFEAVDMTAAINIAKMIIERLKKEKAMR